MPAGGNRQRSAQKPDRLPSFQNIHFPHAREQNYPSRWLSFYFTGIQKEGIRNLDRWIVRRKTKHPMEVGVSLATNFNQENQLSRKVKRKRSQPERFHRWCRLEKELAFGSELSLKQVSPATSGFCKPQGWGLPFGPAPAVQINNVLSWTLLFGRTLFILFRSRRADLGWPKDKSVGAPFGHAERAQALPPVNEYPVSSN